MLLVFSPTASNQIVELQQVFASFEKGDVLVLFEMLVMQYGPGPALFTPIPLDSFCISSPCAASPLV